MNNILFSNKQILLAKKIISETDKFFQSSYSYERENTNLGHIFDEKLHIQLSKRLGVIDKFTYTNLLKNVTLRESQDYLIDRYYQEPNDNAFGAVLLKALSLLGNVNFGYGTYFSQDFWNDYYEGNTEVKKWVEMYKNKNSNNENHVAVCAKYSSIPDNIIQNMPKLANAIFESMCSSTLDEDPDSDCIYDSSWICFDSDYISAFLRWTSSVKTPYNTSSMIKSALYYINMLKEPFFNTNDLFIGEYDFCLLNTYGYDYTEYYDPIGFEQINHHILPICVILRDLLDRINKIYHFYNEQEEKSLIAV